MISRSVAVSARQYIQLSSWLHQRLIAPMGKGRKQRNPVKQRLRSPSQSPSQSTRRASRRRAKRKRREGIKKRTKHQRLLLKPKRQLKPVRVRKRRRRRIARRRPLKIKRKLLNLLRSV